MTQIEKQELNNLYLRFRGLEIEFRLDIFLKTQNKGFGMFSGVYYETQSLMILFVFITIAYTEILPQS